jgi:hypothetical protein
MARLWPVDEGRTCVVPGVGRIVLVFPPENRPGGPPSSFDQMDPADVDVMAFDFSPCAFAGDVIVAVSLSADPPLMTIGTPIVFGSIVQSFIGPAIGPVETYDINCTVTFASGRILDWGAECSVAQS